MDWLNDLAQPWFFWVSAGLVLLIFELIAPAFIFVFFALGALVVGVLAFFGLVDSIQVQVALFASGSAAACFFFHKNIPRMGHTGRLIDSTEIDDPAGLIGQMAVVMTSFCDGRGTVSYRGATWEATCDSETTLTSGTRVRIMQHSNLILMVEPVQAIRNEQLK